MIFSKHDFHVDKVANEEKMCIFNKKKLYVLCYICSKSTTLQEALKGGDKSIRFEMKKRHQTNIL